MTDQTATLLTEPQANTDAGTQPTAAPADAQGAATPPAAPPQATAPTDDYSFTVPEGKALDSEVTEQFTTLAREAKLPKEHAQKVVDMGVALADKWAAQQQQAVKEQVAGWAREAYADPEIGNGNDEALVKTMAVAKVGLKEFASPELVDLLNLSGLGNHPAVIKHFLALGKQAQSDPAFVAGRPRSAPQSAAQVLYGNG
jgi:hypothetical protein